MGATIPKVGAKYKVGDWIASPTTIFRKVVCVMDDGPSPVYGVTSCRSKEHIQWVTEFELDEDGVTVGKPDFERFSKIEAGDIIKMGWTDDREFVRVLARTGEICLISTAPDTKKAKQVSHIAKQLNQLTDGAVDVLDQLDDDEKRMLRNMASTRRASKIADEWHTTEWLCLMNWQLIKE